MLRPLAALPGPVATSRCDGAAIARRLLAWYDRHARDLPWRGSGCTPYRVLVSEIMLQQTQVGTVVPYFERFMRALPTVQALAAEDEQAVLRLWQGLGYYSRARNLHQAAKIIVQEHRGEVPRSLEELRDLPGIGRYTAGAIASIAYGERAAVVDGNVARVLCRLDVIRGDPRTPAVQRRLWKRAQELLPRARLGDFNSALMELGATICTPRAPDCPACPLRRQCLAFAAGLQAKIPRPAARKPTPVVRRDVFVVRDGCGRFLVEQRPEAGRWAGMWQFITRPRGSTAPPEARDVKLIGEIRHALTHRRYHFRVFACRIGSNACRAEPLQPISQVESDRSDGPRGRGPSHAWRGRGPSHSLRGREHSHGQRSRSSHDPYPARWASIAELDELPMPRPQLLILQMVQNAAALPSARA